jgi:DHA1 family tetracycline resistance protein-like MFS transporter
VNRLYPLFILCIGAFFDWASLGLIYPIFASTIFEHDSIFLLTSSDTIRNVGFGLLMAAGPVGQFFFSPVLGMISDQIGRRSVLLVSYVIILIGSALSIFSVWDKAFALLLLARFITGIGGGNLSVINSAIADISHAKDKAKHYAYIAMASGIGFSIGPFIGGVLSKSGFTVPFALSGCCSLATLIVFTLFLPETYSGKHLSFRIRTLFDNFRFTSFRNVRVLFAAFFIFFFGWSFYWGFVPVLWIKNYGLGADKIGQFYTYGSIFYVLSSGLFIQPMIRKFSGHLLLPMAWIFLGCNFLLLLRANVNAYWVFIPLQQFLISMIYPLGTALVSNATPEKQQGKVLGAFQSLQAFAFALTPFVSGILLGLSYTTPLLVGGCASLLACAIFLLRKK